MNKTGWIIFSTIVVLLLGGLVVYTRVTNPPIDVSGVENNSVIAASDQSGNIADRIKGDENGKVILVEYGDYQCPSCSGAYAGVNSLMDEYPEGVVFVFRNFPLTSIHPNAKAAAAVAEAAGQQGKYWEMHDLLYQNQNDWSSLDANKRTDLFKQYAATLELDMDTFNTDIASKAISQKISFDIALGKAASVAATPTFFLNGEKVDDSVSTSLVQGDLSQMKAKIDELLKK